MHCPACNQDGMQPRATSSGVELDECGSCHSLYFDRGAPSASRPSSS